MFKYSTSIRVRYADTDQMGVVYYGNYATFYEVARTELFRHLDLPYSELEKEGIMLPVVELSCRYIKPAGYDELLTIDVSVVDRPTAKIRFEYRIVNESGVLLNVGSTTLVFVDMKTNRPIKAPSRLLELFDSSTDS